MENILKKFNCFNILWDIDDDQDVFQSQLPRKMSVEVDVSDISHIENLNDEIFENNNPTIHTGMSNTLNIIFPFFQGLHKLNKKNNLQEIKMNYIELDDIKIPIQYDIKSKKFSAKLYLKSYEINN